MSGIILQSLVVYLAAALALSSAAPLSMLNRAARQATPPVDESAAAENETSPVPVFQCMPVADGNATVSAAFRGVQSTRSAVSRQVRSNTIIQVPACVHAPIHPFASYYS